MLGNVEVRDFAATMADHKETVKHPEGRGGHREEVQGGDGFTIVLDKREPTLARVAGRGP